MFGKDICVRELLCADRGRKDGHVIVPGDRGRPTASGIDLVRLASPTVTLHRKVALVR
jgi:hypothetical protein